MADDLTREERLENTAQLLQDAAQRVRSDRSTTQEQDHLFAFIALVLGVSVPQFRSFLIDDIENSNAVIQDPELIDVVASEVEAQENAQQVVADIPVTADALPAGAVAEGGDVATDMGALDEFSWVRAGEHYGFDAIDLDTLEDRSVAEEDLENANTALGGAWISAARVLYEERKGEPVPASMSDAELARWAEKRVSWFNNNIGSVGSAYFTGQERENAALMYLVELNEKTEKTWGDFFGGGRRMIMDISNVGTVVAGAFSFGSGGAAVEASKQAARFAVKEMVARAIKKETTRVVVKSAAAAAAESAIFGAGESAMRQRIDMQIEDAEDGNARQETFNYGQLAVDTSIAGAFGAGLGGGMAYLGKEIMPKLGQKFAERGITWENAWARLTGRGNDGDKPLAASGGDTSGNDVNAEAIEVSDASDVPNASQDVAPTLIAEPSASPVSAPPLARETPVAPTQPSGFGFDLSGSQVEASAGMDPNATTALRADASSGGSNAPAGTGRLDSDVDADFVQGNLNELGSLINGFGFRRKSEDMPFIVDELHDLNKFTSFLAENIHSLDNNQLSELEALVLHARSRYSHTTINAGNRFARRSLDQIDHNLSTLQAFIEHGDSRAKVTQTPRAKPEQGAPATDRPQGEPEGPRAGAGATYAGDASAQYISRLDTEAAKFADKLSTALKATITKSTPDGLKRILDSHYRYVDTVRGDVRSNQSLTPDQKNVLYEELDMRVERLDRIQDGVFKNIDKEIRKLEQRGEAWTNAVDDPNYQKDADAEAIRDTDRLGQVDKSLPFRRIRTEIENSVDVDRMEDPVLGRAQVKRIDHEDGSFTEVLTGGVYRTQADFERGFQESIGTLIHDMQHAAHRGDQAAIDAAMNKLNQTLDKMDAATDVLDKPNGSGAGYRNELGRDGMVLRNQTRYGYKGFVGDKKLDLNSSEAARPHITSIQRIAIQESIIDARLLAQQLASHARQPDGLRKIDDMIIEANQRASNVLTADERFDTLITQTMNAEIGKPARRYRKIGRHVTQTYPDGHPLAGQAVPREWRGKFALNETSVRAKLQFGYELAEGAHAFTVGARAPQTVRSRNFEHKSSTKLNQIIKNINKPGDEPIESRLDRAAEELKDGIRNGQLVEVLYMIQRDGWMMQSRKEGSVTDPFNNASLLLLKTMRELQRDGELGPYEIGVLKRLEAEASILGDNPEGEVSEFFQTVFGYTDAQGADFNARTMRARRAREDYNADLLAGRNVLDPSNNKKSDAATKVSTGIRNRWLADRLLKYHFGLKDIEYDKIEAAKQEDPARWRIPFVEAADHAHGWEFHKAFGFVPYFPKRSTLVRIANRITSPAGLVESAFLLTPDNNSALLTNDWRRYFRDKKIAVPVRYAINTAWYGYAFPALLTGGAAAPAIYLYNAVDDWRDGNVWSAISPFHDSPEPGVVAQAPSTDGNDGSEEGATLTDVQQARYAEVLAYLNAHPDAIAYPLEERYGMGRRAFYTAMREEVATLAAQDNGFNINTMHAGAADFSAYATSAHAAIRENAIKERLNALVTNRAAYPHYDATVDALIAQAGINSSVVNNDAQLLQAFRNEHGEQQTLAEQNAEAERVRAEEMAARELASLRGFAMQFSGMSEDAAMAATREDLITRLDGLRIDGYDLSLDEVALNFAKDQSISTEDLASMDLDVLGSRTKAVNNAANSLDLSARANAAAGGSGGGADADASTPQRPEASFSRLYNSTMNKLHYAGTRYQNGQSSLLSDFVSAGDAAVMGVTNLMGGLKANRPGYYSGIIGGIVALIGTPLLKRFMGLNNVPLVGLVIAAVLFFGASDIAHSAVTGEFDETGESGNTDTGNVGQGSSDGGFAIAAMRDGATRIISHEGGLPREFEHDIDGDGDLDIVRLIDADADGQAVLQVSDVRNGPSFISPQLIDLRKIQAGARFVPGANSFLIDNTDDYDIKIDVIDLDGGEGNVAVAIQGNPDAADYFLSQAAAEQRIAELEATQP